jgi:hypothetical protein
MHAAEISLRRFFFNAKPDKLIIFFMPLSTQAIFPGTHKGRFCIQDHFDRHLC